ncbi:methyl-accepting chemotaxis protein [Thiohalorhabdus sp. Cl-TMA]|uniref:Methyl-accepting chemotaxis protein n=1 Tax=Thiohalorhabdus methylotrophus TaxID=3242694 RepID=A0ABV4TVC0_9GAMM
MDGSRLNFLKNLPMAWKMAVIPVLAIVALLGVYLITKINLESYQTKVDHAADADAVIKQLREARIAEQTYLNTYNDQEIEKLNEALGKVEALAQKTRTTLSAEEDRALMDRTLQALENYRSGFHHMVELRKSFRGVNEKLVSSAQAVEQAATALAEDQRRELNAVAGSGGSQQEIGHRQERVKAANRIVFLKKEARIAEKNYKRRDNKTEFQEAKDRVDQLRELARSEKDALREARDRARMDTILEKGATYKKLLDEYSATRDEFQKQILDLEGAAHSMEKAAITFMEGQKQQRNAVRAGMETTVLTVTLAAMAVIGLIAFVTTRIILGPINSVSATVQHIQRDKDFTERARADGNDEIGRMAGSVNDLVDNQTELLNGLQQQTAQVAAASEELSSTADEITRNARSSSQRVEEVSSSAQEVNNVVQDVANNIAEVSDSASKTTDRTQKGMQTVDQAAERIDNLKGSTQRVDEIMETIENIAKQTDLLALNAAIEAANAGEQGKGFAVVADEVRKLAEQTSDATGQVNKIVSELREQSESSVTAMSDVQTQMKEVLEMIEHTDSTANQIAAAAEELAATMGETTSNMTEISSSVEQVAGSVTQVESAAEQLGELAHNLRASVDQYKLE